MVSVSTHLQKYLSKCESSPSRGEHKKYLKPPPSFFFLAPGGNIETTWKHQSVTFQASSRITSLGDFWSFSSDLWTHALVTRHAIFMRTVPKVQSAKVPKSVWFLFVSFLKHRQPMLPVWKISRKQHQAAHNSCQSHGVWNLLITVSLVTIFPGHFFQTQQMEQQETSKDHEFTT